jgi:hypothetical protein
MSDASKQEAPGMTHIRAFVAATLEKERGEAIVAKAKKTLEGLQDPVLEFFARNGIQRVNCDGRTVHQRRSLYPHVPADQKERLIAALKDDPDTEYLIKEGYNHQTLRAFIGELDTHEETGMPVIPTELVGMLEARERFQAICTKTG